MTTLDNGLDNMKHKIIVLFYNLWLCVRRYPMTYELYYLVRYQRKPPSTYPNKRHQAFVTGFQRSGNSYSRKLILTLNPNVSLASHVHNVASIKKALKLSLPIIIIIRDPKNSISSSVVKELANGRNTWLAMKSLYEYLDYYKFLESIIHKKNVKIVHFEGMKSNPTILVQAFYGAIGLSKEVSEDNVYSASDRVKESIKSKKTSAGNYGWSSREKEQLKSEAYAMFSNHKIYLECLSTYRVIGSYADG